MAQSADYARYGRELRAASDEQKKIQVFRRLQAEPDLDSELEAVLSDFLQDRSYGPPSSQIEQMIEVRAFVQRSAPKAHAGEGQKMAAEIKRNPLYRDLGDREESNWFAKGFERIGKWLERLLSQQTPPNLPQASNLDPSPLFGILRLLFWLLLAGLFVAFLAFAIRHFKWRSGLKRQARALLEEDEPDLSRDEYLDQADRMAAEGRYREAVRSLYLACLLLFDEQGVARFLRGETNWEHLRRIERSPSRPLDLDFLPATRKFDVVWYGMNVQGQSDVDAMKGWYLQVAESLKRRAA